MADKADLTGLFDRLSRSAFRQRFRLLEPEQGYLRRKGLDKVLEHAAEFIEQRLAPAEPANYGNRMETALSVTEGCVIENLHTGDIGVSGSEQCRSHL